MADNITVTMFHVTFEHNLADIVNSGGLVPGGSKQGMSELSGRDGFATDSVDKVTDFESGSGIISRVF